MLPLAACQVQGLMFIAFNVIENEMKKTNRLQILLTLFTLATGAKAQTVLTEQQAIDLALKKVLCSMPPPCR
jgi:hypothetical protein